VLRVGVMELRRRPGTQRDVQVSTTLPGLAVTAAHVPDDAELEVDAVLEAIDDAVTIRGWVQVPWAAECRRCLEPVSGRLDVALDEVFEVRPVDGETYPIEGHVIDLEQLVRDAVLLDLPLAPTCVGVGDEACAPVAAAAEPLPSGETAPDDAPADPRWSALSQLEL
jgi:uncharacterized protein